MYVKTIYDILNDISPFELQEEWDNSGLLVGDFNQNVDKVYICLDLDETLLDKVEDNSLIIAHHPIIFKPLKRLIPTSFATKLAVEMIKKNVSFIAMHTNFDKTHLNRYVAEKVMGLNGRSEEFFYIAEVNKHFDDFCEEIASKLELRCLKTLKTKGFIKDVTVTTGSGMGLLNYVKTDMFLTGDIKYHEAMEAKLRDVSLLDIGHFESEKYFVDVLYEVLDLDIEVLKLRLDNPFSYRQLMV